MPAESPAERFATGCRAGRLDYQWDPAARRAVFYPRLVPEGLEWRTSAGLGTVYATTTVHVRGEPPRNVALIELDEGFRMMSRVEGLAPDDVRIGLRVRVDFAPGDPPVPVFRAAGEAA